jgi:signal transduction histidine kinase
VVRRASRSTSARKQAERDRETLLTQTQEQNERLRKLDRLKDEFIALVSHELRTPLTSICGYLELLLQDDIMAELPTAQLNWLEVIDRNAERLRLVGSAARRAGGAESRAGEAISTSPASCARGAVRRRWPQRAASSSRTRQSPFRRQRRPVAHRAGDRQSCLER